MSSSLRYLIFFVLIVGMAYVSWEYMIKPANTDLAEIRIKMKGMQDTLSKLELEKAASKDIPAEIEKIEQTIEAFESKLPPSSEIHTVLENVTLIAQRHGLVPKTIRTQKNKENRGYIEQPLEMELHGNFNSYYSFLLELEKMDRITKIRELKLEKSKGEGQTEARFVMSIFFQSTV